MTALIYTPQEMARQTAAWRQEKTKIALVPTMGAMHAGHLSLIEIAKRWADRVVVSIFVNPLQFGPGEDFEKYPRHEARDIARLTNMGVSLLYLPDVKAMYPDGFSAKVHVSGLSEHLCGKARPGHFDGVATVVTKLLLQVMPDVAVFGEKDYQQLQIIRRLVRDLDVPVEITAGATLREADGLAMSSRNEFLSKEERKIAPVLHTTLQEVIRKLKEDRRNVAAILEQAVDNLKKSGFARVDYFELCDAADLTPLPELDRSARLLAAAWLGNTRLIDNVAVDVS